MCPWPKNSQVLFKESLFGKYPGCSPHCCRSKPCPFLLLGLVVSLTQHPPRDETSCREHNQSVSEARNLGVITDFFFSLTFHIQSVGSTSRINLAYAYLFPTILPWSGPPASSPGQSSLFPYMPIQQEQPQWMVSIKLMPCPLAETLQ